MRTHVVSRLTSAAYAKVRDLKTRIGSFAFSQLLGLMMNQGDRKIKKYGRRLRIDGVPTINSDGTHNYQAFNHLVRQGEFLCIAQEKAPKGSPFKFIPAFYAVPEAKRTAIFD